MDQHRFLPVIPELGQKLIAQQPKESVANVSQVVSLDKSLLTERVGKLPRPRLELLFLGIDLVLGRWKFVSPIEVSIVLS